MIAKIRAKHNVSLLLLSSALSVGSAGAAESPQVVKLSGAVYHGAPAEIMNQAESPKRKKALEAWQEQVMLQLEDKCMHLGNMTQQLTNFFYPQLMKNYDQRMHGISKSMSDFFTQKYNKYQTMKALFEGHKGLHIPKDAPAAMKQDGVMAGQYAQLIRAQDALSQQLDSAKKTLNGFPSLKKKWEDEFSKNEETLKALDNEIDVLEVELETLILKEEKDRTSFESSKEGLDDIERVLDDLQRNVLVYEFELKKLEDEKNQLMQPSADENAIQEETGIEGEDQKKDGRHEQLQEQLEIFNQSIAEKTSEADLLNQKVEGQKKAIESHRLELATLEATLTQASATLKEVEKKKTDLSLDVENLTREKATLAGQIQGHEQSVQATVAQISTLENELKLAQTKAESYALVKYLVALNHYATLPNPDYNLHAYEQDETLHLLSPEIFSYLKGLVNERAAEVGGNNVKLGVDREIKKVEAAVQKAQEGYDGKFDKVFNKFCDKMLANSKGWLCLNGSSSFETGAREHGNMLKYANFSNVLKNYNLNNISKYAYFPSRLSESDFVTLLNKFVQDHFADRVDQRIKKSFLKWRARVEASGLVNDWGLKSTLFNTNIDAKCHPLTISFQHFMDGFKNITFDDLEAKLSEYQELGKMNWSIARMQMTVNYGDDFIKQNQTVIQQVKPIIDFMDTKIARSQDQDHHEKSTGHKALFREGKNDEANQYAFLRYIAYASMTYGLTHDHLGKSLPEHLRIDPVIQKLTSQSKPSIIPPEIRMDYIMAAKAHKWGTRLLKTGDDFIAHYGLKTWIFDQK